MPQEKKKTQPPPGIIDPFKQGTPTPTPEREPIFKEGEIIDPFKSGVPEGIIDPFKGNPVTNLLKEKAAEVLRNPTVQSTISTLSPVLDVLARPNYASAKFADALADDSKSILDAISEGFNELLPAKWAYEKQTKPSYSDVIRRRFPDFSIDNPTATTLLGFVGDIALDPTTYLGVGVAKTGISVGGKTLTKPINKLFREGLKEASIVAYVGEKGTIDLVRALPKAVEKAEKTAGVIAKKLEKAEAKGIDEVLVTQGQADRLIARLNIEKELKNQGYFEAVRSKQDEIETFLNKLSEGDNTKLAETIAKDETLADLKRFGKERIPEELYRSEVRERIEQRIMSLVSTSPELQKKFFEGRGLMLKYGLPFGKQRDLFKVMGLESIINKFNALTAYMESASGIDVFGKNFNPLRAIVKGTEQAGRFVNRDFALPQEYIDRRNHLQDYLQYAVGQTERDTLKLFKLDNTGREKIGQTMMWIDDQTRMMEAQLARQGTELTDDMGASIFRIGMKRFKLNDKEIAIATQLRQDYAELARVEMEVGLLKSNLINYSPRGYEVIGDAEEFSLITRGKFGKTDVPQPYLASSHERKFKTNVEAEAAGLSPELDAAILYAHRVLQSRRAVAIQQFRDSIQEMFGTVSNRGKIEHTGVLPTRYTPGPIPQKIVDDMKMIGEAIYPSGMNENVKYWLQFYDKLMLRPFKIIATTGRPIAFAARQAVSNTFQAALVAGAKAFKAFDPRVALDAAILLAKRGKETGDIPVFMSNFITKHFTGNEGLDGILASRVVLSSIIGDEALMNFARQYKLRTSLGDVYTGEELVQLAREHGIIRELDATGERFSNKVLGGLLKDKQSYKNVVKELAKFWKHAALVEDYSRMGLFLNGIRMGYSADDATKLVNKALFDYQRGLSYAEDLVAKRVVPFYSFTRFALPFIFKQTLKQPGNPATMEKVLRTMEKLLVTGETLNPAELNVFNEKGNNFALEQGIQLSGFDKEGRGTFNVLNNLTPFDILNFFVLEDDGTVDWKRTTEKSIYGALTPYIKLLVAGLADKDFFTDKTIEQASKLGNVEGSLGKVLPQWAKDAIGWENRYNAITGKTAVYANPFIAYYMMQLFPPLRDIVKGNENVDFQNGNKIGNALFAAMNTIVEVAKPIKSKQFDLKEMEEFSMLKTLKDFTELRDKIFGANIRGSQNDADRFERELELFMSTLDKNQEARAKGNIRGQGLGANVMATDQAPTSLERPLSDQQKEFK